MKRYGYQLIQRSVSILPRDDRSTTTTISVKHFKVSIDRVSLSSLLFFIIMPKARRSSYSMAFKSYRGSWSGRKQLGNRSRIWTKRVHGTTLEKRPGDYSFRRAEDVCKTCNDGPFHSEISRTRPASDGVVFTAKRTRLVFTFLI